MNEIQIDLFFFLLFQSLYLIPDQVLDLFPIKRHNATSIFFRNIFEKQLNHTVTGRFSWLNGLLEIIKDECFELRWMFFPHVLGLVSLLFPRTQKALFTCHSFNARMKLLVLVDFSDFGINGKKHFKWLRMLKKTYLNKFRL